MILLRIVSNNEKKSERVAEILLSENLGMDVNIKRHAERLELVNGSLISSRIYILTAKTKSLLFQTIDERLRREFPDNRPEIYALPIVYMDWDDARHLTDSIVKV
jgi:uncharacterized protein involved in tolerance to divalent cations